MDIVHEITFHRQYIIQDSNMRTKGIRKGKKNTNGSRLIILLKHVAV